MRLKTVREDYAYFTQATGERTRNLAYGGIGAAWALNSNGACFAPLLLTSLILFGAFLALDVFGAFYCAKISREIILEHENSVFKITGELPGDNYEFDYHPKFNIFSTQVFWVRSSFAVLGCVPLVIHLSINAA